MTYDLLDMLDDITAERWECGRHKRGRRHHNDLMEHMAECWGNRCPHCGMTMDAAIEALSHDPYGNHYHRFGTCWPQRWMFERVACCMTCHWPTFGQWPCRNKDCSAGCEHMHAANEASCPTELARTEVAT